MKTIIRHSKYPPSYLHRQHSYLKVRYLAFAFETLHYPWIPSFLIHIHWKEKIALKIAVKVKRRPLIDAF